VPDVFDSGVLAAALVDVGPVSATLTDYCRLLAVPVFVWAAYRDLQVRRVPNDAWVPLTLLAVVLLAADTWTAFQAGGGAWTAFVLPATVSVGLVIPLGYAFWYFGGFGGADAKAMFVFALLFPTYPTYLFAAGVPVVPTALPAVDPTSATGVPVLAFSFTVVTNAVLLGVVYPAGVAVRNLLDGQLGWRTFTARVHDWDALASAHGRLVAAADDADHAGGGGLDLDALRMYLQWRGTTLAAVREDPAAFRDPDSLPATPNDPGDGAVATDGGAGGATADEPAADEAAPDDEADALAVDPDDDWGAQAFLDDIDGTAYGTTPDTLRDGLDLLATADRVWVSPGIPFMVPLALGLVTALTVGDVLFWLLEAVGTV
jgi:preflagellin peptidase FlaK